MEATKSLKRERYLFWILVGGLLFLRFPWIILGKALAPAYGAGIVVVFEVGTYLLTALLVFLERKRLRSTTLTVWLWYCCWVRRLSYSLGAKPGVMPCPDRGSRPFLRRCC